MDAILQTLELVCGQNMRQADLAQRAYENQRRVIADGRRLVDKKVEQLKAISSLAALIGGFSMVVLVETQIDPTAISAYLIAAFGLATAFSTGCMLLSMINASLILVAVLNFDVGHAVRERDQPFHVFWATRCESNWLFAFKAFMLGVPSFMISLGLLGWVKFHYSTPTAVVVTLVAAVVIGTWVFHIRANWGRSAFSSTHLFDTNRAKRGPMGQGTLQGGLTMGGSFLITKNPAAVDQKDGDENIDGNTTRKEDQRDAINVEVDQLLKKQNDESERNKD